MSTVMAPPSVLIIAAVTLTACTTTAQQKAAENAAVRREAAREIKRICSLPEDERQAELKRLKDEQGVVISCGKQ